MKDAPLSWLAAAFIVGIWIAKYTALTFLVSATGSFLALTGTLFLLKNRKLSIVCMLLATVLLGGAALKDSQALPPHHISNFTPYKAKRVSIEGLVESDPTNTKSSCAFILRAKSLIMEEKEYETLGRLLVRSFGKESFSYGDRVYLEGNLYRIPSYRISSNFNYRAYMESKGIYSILSISKNSHTRVLENGRGSPLKTLAYRLRREVKEMIADNMSPFSASMLSAIILGTRENMPDPLRQIMVRSGTIHIIAISGLHVGLVSLIILMILKFFGTPRKTSYIITFCMLVFYCILTGARTPVVRVTLMATIIFTGLIINRKASIYNALGAAALVILVINPTQIFDLSFQLSFVSVISILALSPKIKNYLFKNADPGPVKRTLGALFSTSFAAWAGLLPLTVYYFKIVTPIAVLANMIVVPYMALVVGGALLAITVGYIIPSAAPIFFATCELSVVFLIKMIELFVSLPGSHFYISQITSF
ncbi:MAG: ComEC/Rec2 family competence protein [Candidatus Omnitrophota bacterium]